MNEKLAKYVLGLSKNAKASNSRLRQRMVYHLINLVILYLKLHTRIKFGVAKMRFSIQILKNNLKIIYIRFKIFLHTIYFALINVVRIPGYITVAIFLIGATLIRVFPIEFMRDMSINMWERRPLTFEQKKFVMKMQDLTTHATWISWIVIAFFYWRGRIAV